VLDLIFRDSAFVSGRLNSSRFIAISDRTLRRSNFSFGSFSIDSKNLWLLACDITSTI